jgi:hypothetical protein
MPEEDESSLERVRRRLYEEKNLPPLTPPSLSHTPRTSVPQGPSVPTYSQNNFQNSAPPTSWTPPPMPKAKAKKRMSWTVLFLGICLLFFVAAGGISAYFFFSGDSSVSSNNIIITVQGPSSISSGATVPLTITIENKNPAAINGSDLSIAYPDGTRSADDITQPLVRYATTIGTIPAGGSVTLPVIKSVLFGSINQAVSIPITFQYNTPNSNALFVKQDTYTSTITSSPLIITAQSVSSVAPGQTFTIALNVRSSGTASLSNIAVDAAYPSGFTPNSIVVEGAAVQAASSSDASGSLIPLGTLAPSEQKTINITGSLSGATADQQSFGFTVGTQATDGSETLGVDYASQTTNITLTKPFLAVSLSLNNAQADPTIVTAGSAISGVVTWINSLTSSITNGSVSIKITGNALDPSRVTATNGYFDSSSNTITYDPQTESSLGLLSPNDTGNGGFSLYTKTNSALNSIQNPTIKLSVTVSGQPSGQNAQTISNTLTDTIKVATDLTLHSEVVHTSGPFTNSGALPPVPNKPTTYTVELAVSNSMNAVGGAVATMILPDYVTYTGQVTPSDGSVTYDDSTHTVTWTIGNVAAGTGSATKAQTAAFQVSFTPSDSQVGTSPVLVGNQTLTGTDRFTSTSVGMVAPALTIQMPTDSGYSVTFGTVGN